MQASAVRPGRERCFRAAVFDAFLGWLLQLQREGVVIAIAIMVIGPYVWCECEVMERPGVVE